MRPNGAFTARCEAVTGDPDKQTMQSPSCPARNAHGRAISHTLHSVYLAGGEMPTHVQGHVHTDHIPARVSFAEKSPRTISVVGRSLALLAPARRQVAFTFCRQSAASARAACVRLIASSALSLRSPAPRQSQETVVAVCILTEKLRCHFAPSRSPMSSHFKHRTPELQR